VVFSPGIGEERIPNPHRDKELMGRGRGDQGGKMGLFLPGAERSHQIVKVGYTMWGAEGGASD